MMKTACMAALVFCTSCSTIGDLGSKALTTVGKLSGLNPAPAAPATPAIPTDALAQRPGNVLMVTLLGRNAVAAMTRVGSNNGVETWRTAKGVTLSFRDGLLIGSRGLNEDMMGADLIGVQDALATGTGSTQRKHAFLDSEDQIIFDEATCEVSTVGPEDIVTAAGPTPTIKIDEVCKGTLMLFTNSYWFDELGGEMLQSQQVLARGVGFIKVNKL